MAKDNSGYNNNMDNNESEDKDRSFFSKKEKKDIEAISKELIKLCVPLQEFLDEKFDDDMVVQVSPYSVELLIRGMSLYMAGEDEDIPFKSAEAWDLDVDGGFFDDHTESQGFKFKADNKEANKNDSTFKFKPNNSNKDKKSKKNKKK